MAFQKSYSGILFTSIHQMFSIPTVIECVLNVGPEGTKLPE